MAVASNTSGHPVDHGRDHSNTRRRTERSRSSSGRSLTPFSQLGLTRSDTGESSKTSGKFPATATPPADTESSPTHIEIRTPDDEKRTPKSRRVRSGGFLLSPGLRQKPDLRGRARPQPSPSSRRSDSTRDDKGKTPVRHDGERPPKKRAVVGLGIGGSPASRTDESVGGDGASDAIRDTSPVTTLDQESAHIVNLALNLSESRRNARRNVSSPLPALMPVGESFAGQSLRNHLQQQRRTSRNLSPRTASPRVASSERIDRSPLHAFHDGDREYPISASTLARAQKAKQAIELMAQYRRLLQHLPPLKPQLPSRLSTAVADDDALSPFTTANPQTDALPLGRPYNPLQYIRNRKVRARERQTIDGEAQGFGNVDQVSSWVDDIAHKSLLPGFQTNSGVVLPPLSDANGHARKGEAVVKRPRIDWITKPADMLAEVVWLEADDNKTLIEDHYGRKMFLRGQGQTLRNLEDYTALGHDVDMSIDGEYPNFKSIRTDSDKIRGRARQKIHDATHFRHHQDHLRHVKSDSDLSDSDSARHSSRHRRSGTAESQEFGQDVFEKQMNAMIAKAAQDRQKVETKDSNPSLKQTQTRQSGYSAYDSTGNSSPQSRMDSIEKTRTMAKIDSQPPSGRASLEVPGMYRRRSGERDLIPSSPEVGETRRQFAEFPSRQSSPSRRPLERVRSKINALREGGRRDPEEVLPYDASATDLSDQFSSPSNRRRKYGRDADIKDMIKNGRSNIEDMVRTPVSRVGDLLWKRESGSESSEDESEEERKRWRNGRRYWHSRGASPVDDAARNTRHQRLELPKFTSSMRRGKAEATSLERNSSRHRTSRFERLKPPRIDVQIASPASSPDLRPVDRNSDVSDLESHRGSSMSRVSTSDKQIADILAHPGMIGKKRLPESGLSALAVHHERPTLVGRRQWSISDNPGSLEQGPASRLELARTKALLLSTGIKAHEIARRAHAPTDLAAPDHPAYAAVAALAREPLAPVRCCEAHLLAARILSHDLDAARARWQAAANAFCTDTAASLLDRVAAAEGRIALSLTPVSRAAADDADAVSRHLVTDQTLALKQLADAMDTMLRRRRRKFRWVRRAGWLLVEWALVGIMWWVWLVVVLLRVARGLCHGVVGTLRWLLWLG